jgi:hypothetical protein
MQNIPLLLEPKDSCPFCGMAEAMPFKNRIYATSSRILAMVTHGEHSGVS